MCGEIDSHLSWLSHVEARGQLGGVGSLLPSHRVWGLNSVSRQLDGEIIYFSSKAIIYHGGQGMALVPAAVCGLLISHPSQETVYKMERQHDPGYNCRKDNKTQYISKGNYIEQLEVLLLCQFP